MIIILHNGQVNVKKFLTLHGRVWAGPLNFMSIWSARLDHELPVVYGTMGSFTSAQVATTPSSLHDLIQKTKNVDRVTVFLVHAADMIDVVSDRHKYVNEIRRLSTGKDQIMESSAGKTAPTAERVDSPVINAGFDTLITDANPGTGDNSTGDGFSGGGGDTGGGGASGDF